MTAFRTKEIQSSKGSDSKGFRKNETGQDKELPGTARLMRVMAIIDPERQYTIRELEKIIEIKELDWRQLTKKTNGRNIPRIKSIPQNGVKRIKGSDVINIVRSIERVPDEIELVNVMEKFGISGHNLNKFFIKIDGINYFRYTTCVGKEMLFERFKLSDRKNYLSKKAIEQIELDQKRKKDIVSWNEAKKIIKNQGIVLGRVGMNRRITDSVGERGGVQYIIYPTIDGKEILLRVYVKKEKKKNFYYLDKGDITAFVSEVKDSENDFIQYVKASKMMGVKRLDLIDTRLKKFTLDNFEYELKLYSKLGFNYLRKSALLVYKKYRELNAEVGRRYTIITDERKRYPEIWAYGLQRINEELVFAIPIDESIVGLKVREINGTYLIKAENLELLRFLFNIIHPNSRIRESGIKKLREEIYRWRNIPEKQIFLAFKLWVIRRAFFYNINKANISEEEADRMRTCRKITADLMDDKNAIEIMEDFDEGFLESLLSEPGSDIKYYRIGTRIDAQTIVDEKKSGETPSFEQTMGNA